MTEVAPQNKDPEDRGYRACSQVWSSQYLTSNCKPNICLNHKCLDKTEAKGWLDSSVGKRANHWVWHLSEAYMEEKTDSYKLSSDPHAHMCPHHGMHHPSPHITIK